MEVALTDMVSGDVVDGNVEQVDADSFVISKIFTKTGLMFPCSYSPPLTMPGQRKNFYYALF